MNPIDKFINKWWSVIKEEFGFIEFLLICIGLSGFVCAYATIMVIYE